MKYTTILFILIILISVGCDEDWLEIPVEVDKTIENFYKTPEDAEAALAAAYSTFKFSGIAWSPEQLGSVHGLDFFMVGEIVSDNADKGGGGRNDNVERAEYAEFAGKSNAEFILNIWRDCYIGIFRANLVIEKVPDIEMDQALKDQYVAEAKFIRAYWHFHLLRIFGDIPLVDHILPPSEYTQERTPTESVYAKIEEDLEAGIGEVLPLSYPSDQVGRITRGAAQALLTKVYVFQKKWALAEEMADNVIKSREYDLNTPYSKIFTSAGENSSESVFEIQFMESGNSTWHSQNNGNNFYTYMRSRDSRWPTSGQGWGFCVPTQNLVDAFEDDDPRKDLTIVFDGETAPWGGDILYTDKENSNPAGYTNQKYSVLPPDEVPVNWSDAPNNLRIIRYADLMLWYAEASFHNNKEQQARNALNLVRARARKEAQNPSTALPDVTSSGSDLLNAIYHERRVELAMEGHRFFDLVRTGRAPEVMNNFYATNPLLQLDNPFVEGVHELFAIPQAEIVLSQGKLTQNPGY